MLRQALESIGPLQSSSSWSEQFWPRLAERLASMAPGLMLQPIQADAQQRSRRWSSEFAGSDHP